MTIELPYPPSVNNYWVHTRNGTFLSKRAKQFRKDVCAIVVVTGGHTIGGPVKVEVDVYPPLVRRVRDLDNILKGLLDALEHAGAYHDDGQISELTIKRRGVVKGGKTVVRISKAE